MAQRCKGMIVIEEDRCKGCRLCVPVCPTQILTLAVDRFNTKGYHPIAVTEMNRCTGCAICAVVCPDVVFAVYRQRKEPIASEVANG